MKVQTNLLIDEELKNLAKSRKISLSKTLNDALAVVLAVPNTKEDIDNKVNKLKVELDTLQRKKQELDALGKLEQRKDRLEAFSKDIKYLRLRWRDFLQGEVKSDHWSELISTFCDKWDIDRALALQYAEGSKGPVTVG